MFASAVLEDVGGPPWPSETHLTVSWYLYSSRRIARGKVEGPCRAPCQLVKPLKEEGTNENNVLLDEGSLMCSRQISYG